MKPATRYTLIDEISASDTEPLSRERQTFHLMRMNEALRSIERAPAPTYDDWKVMCTVVNMMETLAAMGILTDDARLVPEAQRAIAEAGERKPHRFAGGDLQIVRSLIANYTYAVENVSARVMIRAHRITERRAAEAMGFTKKQKARRRAVAVDF